MNPARQLIVSGLLLGIVPALSWGHGAQSVSIIVSKKPLNPNWQQVVSLRQTHDFGKYEPADHPEAWTSLNAITAGPDGSVFVLDYGTRHAYRVVPNSGVVTKYGNGEGSGPGEFQAPTRLAWSGARGLYILDRALLRISVFDLNGAFQESILVGQQVFSMAFSADRSLWISGLLSRPFDRITRISATTGEPQGYIGGDRYVGEPWAASGINSMALCTYENGILASPGFPYEILDYSFDGNLRRVFGRVLEWLNPMAQDERGVWGQKNGYKQKAVMLQGGYTLVMLHFYGDRPEGKAPDVLFDLFASDGRWLTTFPGDPMNMAGVPIDYAVASDGALWILASSDWPKVYRFEIGIDLP